MCVCASRERNGQIGHGSELRVEANGMAENGRARSRERVIESERSGEGEEVGRMKQQRSCNYGCAMKIDGSMGG